MKKIIFVSFATIFLFALPILTYASEGKISGTVDYQGEKTGKIIIATLAIPPDMNEPIQYDTLDAPGYYEITGLTTGTYFIGVYMDVNSNGFPGLDEPVGLYPAPIPLDTAGIAENIDVVIKDLPRGTGTISGKVNYIGVRTGEVRVYAIGITKTPFSSDHLNWCETDSFSINGLFGGEYLVVAFLDEDGNKLPELTEPMGFVQAPVLLENGQHISDVQITLFDIDMYTSSISGTAFYSGQQKGNIHVIAAGLSFTPINEILADSLTGDFKIENLAAGEYHIFSYLDIDNNGNFDMGEPFVESYLDKMPLGWGQDTTGIELFLIDQGTGAISGSVAYNGSEQGLITVIAAGLSATPLNLSPVIPFGPGPYPYSVKGLAPGIYTVAGKLIDLTDPPEEIIDYLKPPIGFYIDDFIYIVFDRKPHNCR